MANTADSRKTPGAPGLPGVPSVKPLHGDDEFLTTEELASASEFEQLLAMEASSHTSPGGEALVGRVISITEQSVFVDIGHKLEGMVPRDQVVLPDGTMPVQPGDEIEVAMARNDQRADGFILLTFERASRVKAWDSLEAAFRDGLPVNGRVLARVKGGLDIDVGTKAFMPSSQVDMRPLHNLDALVGQDIPVRIVKLNRRRGNVVVSRRVLQEEEFNARKDAVLGNVEEGSVVTGTVKNLTDYGAFIDLGGIDGLLHVSDMSHGRVNHPQEIVQPGDTITARVLKLDKAKGRVSLGIKQLVPDPWETVEERYQKGGKVIGRVVSVTDYGSFVEIESGVEGLIHISEMTWSRRMKHPTKVLKAGDSVECVILDVKSSERRISLGIKQLEADPWTTIQDRYSIGSVVEGRVRKLTDFGAFLEVEEGVDGLIHISDFSWTKRLKHPSEMLKRGQTVQAAVLNIDVASRRLSLGIKQLQPDAWETFFQNHFVNDVVRGKVIRAATFGVFVEVAPGVEGLCHNVEIPGAHERRGDKRQLPVGESPLPVGAEFNFKIIKMSENEKKVGLSLKELASDEERERIEEYQVRAAQRSAEVENALRPERSGGDS